MRTQHETRELLPIPTGVRSRRIFLAESAQAASGGWLALRLSLVAALAACADGASRETTAHRRLTQSEARTMRAVAARIIPSDDGTPGADEARAVSFVDHAMGMALFAEAVPFIRAGLSDLDERARAAGARRGFAALATQGQIDLLRQIEHTQFFASARTLVVMGTLADSTHGGNANGTGWSMIGMEHKPSYTAPFGWYDALANADSARAR